MRTLIRVGRVLSLFVAAGSILPRLWQGPAAGPAGALAQTTPVPESLSIDAKAPGHHFPHFWEEMFGSGRAILSLREDYRRDLRSVKAITDLHYVRFHDIFDDEVGVYNQDGEGKPVYNFSYVDQIYDGLLAAGVKPFVELSFMPRMLSARLVLHAFWYKPNVAPPADYDRWAALVEALARHLVTRYGAAEVETWYFEVWNEPNLDFWAGNPRQATYWQLYDAAAKAIKKVDPDLRVGGPATAQTAWVPAFLQHCSEAHVPVDFVSTHVYGNDRAQDVFGTIENIPRDQMVCRAVNRVRGQIQASAWPDLPLIWSEFNASYMNEPAVTDSIYMGPWLADTIRQCDGLTRMMSYWTFSDVFEEQGVVRQPFYGGFGLIAERGVPKPSFAAFKLLHGLGVERLAVDSDSALVTRRKDGTVVVAVWNYSAPDLTGAPRTLTLKFKGTGSRQVSIARLDREHGDAHAAYEKMGSPPYPSERQLATLRQAAKLPAAETVPLQNGELRLTLPDKGLAVMELK